MDPVILSRIQFAFTAGFHYIFPPLSIGLGVLLVIMEGRYLQTREKIYEEMTRFWIKVFALIFAVGVASGIVLEFQFGTNWSAYSRYVGDVFGSALAAEGIFAFFLESGFLAILVFGWNKVGPKMHFFATCMVSLGSIFSALWILIANSWQQTPAGHHIVENGSRMRAEITDFWALVFNPSTVDRLSHVLSAALITGAFLVLSVSAYYVLKGRHLEFARRSMRIALTVGLIAAILQIATGHESAMGVTENQPAKLAAFEGHWKGDEPAGFYLFGWVDEGAGETYGLEIPGMLSYMVHGDFETPVPGLDDFAPDIPPVNIVFQSYHIMVGLGGALFLLTALGAFYSWRGVLYKKRWLLTLMVPAVALPHLGNFVGWVSAEVGRQPWIVYGQLRTVDGVSPTLSGGQALFSLILFVGIYGLLLLLFLFLLDRKIKHGPGLDESTPDPAASAA